MPDYTNKTDETKIILVGDPVLEAAEATEAIVPAQLLLEAADGTTVTGATNALIWSGAIALDKDELGQGFSGVFATDSAAANLYAIGDEVRYAVVNLAEKFQGWALALSADILVNSELEVITDGTYKGCLQLKAAGVTVAIAREAIAMSGIAVNTPVKARRV